MAQRAETSRTRAWLFAQATAIVERDHTTQLELDDVALELATSRRQLQRIYREVGQTTFRDQRTHVRMQHAAHALLDRRRTVRQVARSVGYTNSAQFAKAFQRCHGCTPSAYRNAHHPQAR